MNIKNLKGALLPCVAATLALNCQAANIDAAMARTTANEYLKHQVSLMGGMRTAPSMADLRLAHAEASSALPDAHDYYAFNITGGGFVIVAGEDRATPVLGYSDQGRLDFNRLPDNFKALLQGYKEEIEYLQRHPSLEVTPRLRTNSGAGVAPLIRSNWGQEMPYYLQCPTYQGEYCVVGCVATAMSQVMHYWEYPTIAPALNSFYCYEIGQTVTALPESSFDYSKMLNSYCHWDWDLGQLIQDTYTDAQAQAVAKLARYCGQAVHMGYSPNGSGAYVDDQLAAMKTFGYSADARDVMRSSWWSENYTTEQWEALIRTELDARRPILYSANDPNEGGHAFVCDGYNGEGLFHFNFGWYGTCNGWYASTALNMTHRDGSELHFNSSHEMLVGVEPPDYCVISTDPLGANGALLVIGEDDLEPTATGVNILSNYSYVNVRFSLINATGRIVASSNSTRVAADAFAQTSVINGSLPLPATLEPGIYDLMLYRYTTSARLAKPVNCDAGRLTVVGHVAKYGSSFQIDDVVTLIDYVLSGNKTNVDVYDVTKVINYVLTGSLSL